MKRNDYDYKQTDRQTDKQRDRQRDKETYFGEMKRADSVRGKFDDVD